MRTSPKRNFAELPKPIQFGDMDSISVGVRHRGKDFDLRRQRSIGASVGVGVSESGATQRVAPTGGGIMPVFNYVAQDIRGRSRRRTEEADNPQALVSRLRGEGLFVTSYQPVAGKRTKKRKLSEITIIKAKVKKKDLMMFSDQFAAMLDAGIDITECLDALEEQSGNPTLRETISKVKEDVTEGKALAKALAEHPKVFDHLYVSMIEAAEASGSYTDVLTDLATSLDKAEEIKRKVKSALQMPLITISIAIAVTFGLIKFAVPQFADLFKTFGGNLPLPTRVLMGVSDFLQGWTGWLSIAMVVVLTVGLRKLIRTKKGKGVWDRIKLKLPLFGSLILKRAIVSFSSTLSLLLRSGVDYLTALDIVKNVADNEVIKDVLENAQQCINRGEKLSKPFIESEIFPPLVIQMIRSGEDAGRVDTMLGKLAALYERDVDQSVENLSKALEPMLTVILGILVGSVLMGLYMPMFQVGAFMMGG